MVVLNKAFDIAGFDFELVAVTWSYADDWFNDPWITLAEGEPTCVCSAFYPSAILTIVTPSHHRQAHYEAKTELRQGNEGTLNIWTAK